MSLKSELVELKDRLSSLKERIEADDAEAINEGISLKAEIETKESEIEMAESKASLLSVIGKTDKVEEKEMETNELKSMNMENLKSAPGSVSTYIKAATDVETSTQQSTYDNNVFSGGAPLGVRGAFGAESISTNALTYYVLGETEGEVSGVDEGGAKPQIHVPYEPVTAALQKIAAFFKETDELLSDNAFLESAIRNRGRYEFDKAVEGYLVTELMGTSGVGAENAAISFDSILDAKQSIMSGTGYAADTLIINPADWSTLLKSKDSNLQYLLGGPAYGSYGNGGYNSNPKVWGLNVIESASVPSGFCVVGAFKAGAAVISKAGEGMRIEVSNSDQNDFIYNRITVRLEERILLAVRVPGAFCIVGVSNTPGGN